MGLYSRIHIEMEDLRPYVSAVIADRSKQIQELVNAQVKMTIDQFDFDEVVRGFYE